MPMAEATPDRFPFRCGRCGHGKSNCTAEHVRMHRTIIKGVREWILITCPKCGDSATLPGSPGDPTYWDVAKLAVTTAEITPPRDVI